MGKYIFFICCLFVIQTVSAQSLIVNGFISINETSPEGSRIIISKNGQKIDEQVLNKKGRFDLKLALGADYKINFEKSGYISKSININTEIPDEILESNPDFPPVKLTINLLPFVEGVDLSVFEQPIAILAYNAEVDDLTFDEEYSKKIKDRVAQSEQAIRRTLATRSAAALEAERQFALLLDRGQQSFDRKEWEKAIESWNEALKMKPAQKEIQEKIDLARQEAEREKAQKAIELQNLKAYELLIASGDNLFQSENYAEARVKFTEALKIDAKNTYPQDKIKAIDALLAAISAKETARQKQLAQLEADYQKVISTADQDFNAQNYEKAIAGYQQALTLKAGETYPQEKMTKARQALENLQKQLAAEAEQKRLAAEKQKEIRNKYDKIIAEADQAFKNENYSLSRLRYTDADQLNLGESYPKKQIQAIDNIIHSAKYQAKLAEYNKNKNLAEQNLKAKKYAAAKVYYLKALDLSGADREMIQQQIDNIDREIEAEQLAALEKEYKAQIEKADKAFQDKAYAIAKFYYQKALEIKIGDRYASERLKEVENNISTRKGKEAEL